MKKLIKLSLIIALGFCLISYLANIQTPQAKAATDTVALDTSISTYLSFSISAGDSLSLGALTPGTPITGANGSVATVSTNAANGYTLGLSDGKASTNSALLHTDTTTHIADYAGTIGTPTAWTGTGLGVSMWAADTTPEAKWCADVCTAFDDAGNKYAGIPQNATTAHTVEGFRDTPDTSSWGWMLDAPNDQKTGSYSGNVTFTATAVLS